MHIRYQPYTRDDEGKRVVLMESDGFAKLPSVGDERMAAMIRRLDHSINGRGAGRAAAVWGISIPFLCLAVRWALPAGSSPWMATFAVLGVGLVAFPLLYRWFMAKEADRIAKVLLEDGICPCCSYNFAGLERAEAIFTCPECGAAWRSERIVRAEEFAAGSRPRSRWGLGRGSRGRARTVILEQIKDDRGRPVARADRALRCASVQEGDSDHERRLDSARFELATIGQVARVLVAGFFIVIGLVVLGIVGSMWFARPAGGAMATTLGGGIMGGLFTLFLGAAVYRGAFAYPTSQVNPILLKHALCPACAASLKGATPDSDGCTECAECGAAWRMTPPPGAP